ncbi:TlyA family RNA methyltransferase [Actinopolymorpha alba]|uniref:TlyA family RNA methyltransferase n=1 Tax=Actinopolymorpha alba TaxID=533267 RepID=UPI00037C5DA1|nr:TlyA family RNA methyltransferase [Actinopolymorpha alba]
MSAALDRPDATPLPGRLDTELVRRGLARSRDHAVELIGAGRVRLQGRDITKAATKVSSNATIEVVGSSADDYVSRGAHKLAGALAEFGPRGLDVRGRRCLDAGASTGGFTEVLLRAGAGRVVAVDVGHDQLAPSLRAHPAVEVHERTHIRDLAPDRVGGVVELLVADLSFISLTAVLPALRRLVMTDGDLVLLVKPQFEVGRQQLGRTGVVRDFALRREAVRTVAQAAWQLGLGVAGLAVSQLPGPSGNTEFFLWLRAGAQPLGDAELDRVTGQTKETSS